MPLLGRSALAVNLEWKGIIIIRLLVLHVSFPLFCFCFLLTIVFGRTCFHRKWCTWLPCTENPPQPQPLSQSLPAYWPVLYPRHCHISSLLPLAVWRLESCSWVSFSLHSRFSLKDYVFSMLCACQSLMTALSCPDSRHPRCLSFFQLPFCHR